MQLEKKKIVFVVPSLKGGGAEKLAITLLESLVKPGEAIELITVLFGSKSSCDSSHVSGMRFLNVRESRGVFYTAYKFFKIIFRLSKIIRSETPCTVLSFMDYSNIVSIIANWLAGAKNRIIISVHILPSDILKYKTNLREVIAVVLMRLVHKNADSIVAVSKGVYNDLVDTFKISETQIQLIHNPVDLGKIDLIAGDAVTDKPFDEDIPIILSAGRLSRQKGFDFLLKAFSLLLKEKDARLVILGKGREEENLKRLCITLGIEKYVFFLGFKDNPYKYMRRSTVFVLSSLYEAFGIVLTEAMACGLPVIATNCYAGIEEVIVHEKNGLLVPVADEKALAVAMLRLLNNPGERERYSNESKEQVKKFSLEEIIPRYKKMLLDTN